MGDHAYLLHHTSTQHTHIYRHRTIHPYRVLLTTQQDQLLENVIVRMEPDAEEFEVKKEIPCPKLEFNNSGMKRVESIVIASVICAC